MGQAGRGGAAAPRAHLGRCCVEYRIAGVAPVRVFVAKAAPKSPLLRDTEVDPGLARQGNVLRAVNEWRTWFGTDSIE